MYLLVVHRSCKNAETTSVYTPKCIINYAIRGAAKRQSLTLVIGSTRVEESFTRKFLWVNMELYNPWIDTSIYEYTM